MATDAIAAGRRGITPRAATRPRTLTTTMAMIARVRERDHSGAAPESEDGATSGVAAGEGSLSPSLAAARGPLPAIHRSSSSEYAKTLPLRPPGTRRTGRPRPLAQRSTVRTFRPRYSAISFHESRRRRWSWGTGSAATQSSATPPRPATFYPRSAEASRLRSREFHASYG